MKPMHVVIIGLGDTGLLAAMKLSKYVKVTAIGTKPSFMSGQELGLRLVEPNVWQQHYQFDFLQFNHLKGVNIIHGKAKNINPNVKQINYQTVNGQINTLDYDALLIASGISNGFWRDDQLTDTEQVNQQFLLYREKIRWSKTIHIIGGGPSAVSAAFNIKRQYTDKVVKLFFSRDRVLPQYPEKTRAIIHQQLEKIGVLQYPNHRAIIDNDITILAQQSLKFNHQNREVKYPESLTLWAIGLSQPNNDFIPAGMLTPDGFVNVDNYLSVIGHDAVFAVGDIANSDPHRSSARNNGYSVAACNILAYLNGQPIKRTFVAPRYRWGSILGIQPTGLGVFSPTGRLYRFNKWLTDKILFPFFVRRMIYKGIKG